jgi:cell wall-associated NlpC family hydrolase
MRKLAFGAALAVFGLIGLIALGLSAQVIGGGPPSAGAQRDIPPTYLALYQAAADTCPGLPWSVLAAIGKVESDHGRSVAPGVTSWANFAGAAGPMQIGIGGKAGGAFYRYAVDADGGGASVYSPADAVFTAANYLCQHGAARGADVAGAVFAYNHADWYVAKVLALASTYAATQGLPPGAPAEEVVAAAVQFAYGQLGHPYRWGATGEEGFYDCSGLMLRAYQAGGVQLPRTSREQWFAGARVPNAGDLQPGDLVFFANDLADPATIHHVGIYIGAGNMIDAPHRGAVVRITPFLRPDYIGAVRPTAPPR